MELVKKYDIEGILIVVKTDNNTEIITKKVRLSSKRPQRVRAVRENLEDKFLKIARIENKKQKKQNFFNSKK